MTPFIVIGGGGHATVVIDLLSSLGAEVLFATDRDRAKHGTRVRGVEVAGDESRLDAVTPASAHLALGLGAGAGDFVARLAARQDLADGLAARGFDFPVLVHPSATVAGDADIRRGAQVMAGAVVQPGTRIGEFAIINTRASVDHDATIGDGAHIAPGVTLGGNVTIGRHAFIGLGAAIIQGVSVGAGALVAAGAAVIGNVAAGARVAGVPAKEMA